MDTITIKKTNGESFVYSAYLGYKINKNTLINNIQKNGINENEVVSLKIESSSIEIDWGNQFSSFPCLTEVIVIAKETIRLNCYNFSDSTVRIVKLIANELWFNDGAFSSAKNLEYVTCVGRILDGWHEGLSEYLFNDCPKLKEVNGLYIGESLMCGVFLKCTSLEKPLDLHVKDLGFCAFMDCANLKRIHLHNGLIGLGGSSFKNCISLEDVYVPDTVTYLGSESFSGCKKLKNIHLPANLSLIPSGTFKDCSELTKVFLADSITKIDSEAFKGCSSLRSPWFPEKLKSIGNRAFCGCISMEKIYLPDSITEIGEDAFSNCGNLIISGKPGTYAEQYAKDNGLRWIAQ